MNTYEKKYNYVLKRAKALKECSLSPRIKDWVDSVFPELKESEDEKIRKDIKRAISVALDYSYFDKETTNNCLAWLENQGKEECTLKSSKDEDVRKFMQYIEKEAKAYEFNLPNRSYDIYAFAKDILVWLEKQGNRREQLINKACELLVNCIEDFMLRRMEVWDGECKKQTLENIRKKLEE